MEEDRMLLELVNSPRDYAWGSRTAIAEYLGTPPSGGPEAEVWFGTHPGSPARTPGAVDGESHATLAGWLAAHPELAPGPAGVGAFPILLKVLAAAEPLSLQVHPTPAQARAGFDDEESRGVAVDDPARNYKDPFPKPEIIVAVSERFDALCGFRPVEEVAAIASALASLPAAAPFAAILADAGAIEAAVAWLLSGSDDVAPVIAAITSAAETASTDPAVADALDVVHEVSAHHPGDPGIGIAMLMNRVRLRRGECLFTPAGLLHAYLSGLGIELMTASDNVVRGGLTPKHVDTVELRRLLSFEQRKPEPLAPEHPQGGVVRFEPPVPWRLDLVDPDGGTISVPLEGPSLVLAERAPVRIDAGDAGLSLERGGAAFADADAHELRVSGEGRLWIATSLTGR